MTTAIVMAPDGLSGLRGAPEPSVDQGGFANARGADEDDGAIRMEIRLQVFESYAFARAYNVSWHARSNLSNLFGSVYWVARKVCLVEHDDRTGAAPVNQFTEALQASQIEVAIESHHNKDNVDVRRQQLRALFTGSLAYERARARQHALDGGWPVA